MDALDKEIFDIVKLCGISDTDANYLWCFHLSKVIVFILLQYVILAIVKYVSAMIPDVPDRVKLVADRTDAVLADLSLLNEFKSNNLTTLLSETSSYIQNSLNSAVKKVAKTLR